MAGDEPLPPRLPPEGDSGPPRAGGPTPPREQVFIDIQGGPAVRGDTGEPTFLPTLVAGAPAARGYLIEPADYIPGYGGITTAHQDDLALARILAQNLPRWPEQRGLQPQPAPWEWDPTLAFPTQGPVQVLTRPGAPGTTPGPQAFFPPIGGAGPGGRRLIPIALGGRTAQQDVTGLQVSAHPELHGQVDRAYWRRPFALGAADSQTLAAMGRELGRMLRPDGFLELRLLRGSEEAQARAIAAAIPGARVVTVPRGAIEAFVRNGARPPNLSDEQWTILQDAGPDIRGEFGALGQGVFARIVRIYRSGTTVSPGPNEPSSAPRPGEGGEPTEPASETPTVLRGAAAAVENSMFVAEAPTSRQKPAEVEQRIGGPNGANVEQVKELIRSALPGGQDILVDYRKEDASFLISYPPRKGAKDREWVRIQIEAVDPATLPLVDGRTPPAHYERFAGARAAVQLTDADIAYRVRVSNKTDPLNVEPALAHEIAEIHRVESERRALGRKVSLDPQPPDALTPTSKAKTLSAHDVGRLEQLRVRMDQAARAQGTMGMERTMALALRDDVHALVHELGLAVGDADGQRRLALIMVDPGLSQETRLAVSRAVADVRIELAINPVAEAAMRARTAATGDRRKAFEAAYSDARRRQREAAQASRSAKAEEDAVTRAIARVSAADPANGPAADRLLKLDPAGMRAVLASDTVESQRRAMIDLAATLRRNGMSAPDIGANIRALKALLDQGGLRTALEHERRLAAHAVMLGSFDPVLASYVRESPELSVHLAADPDYLRYRFERHRSRNPGLTTSQADRVEFIRHVRMENQPQHVRPALGELTAIHHLAETEGMTGVLRGGAGSHAPNAPGFDIVGFVPTPDGRPRPPKVPVILADDKSHEAARLSSASAVVENLFKNIAIELGRQEAALRAHIAAGHPIDPDHAAAVAQIRAAYDALKKIENDPRFKGRPERFDDPDYIAAVKIALRKQRIRIIITSTLGNVAALSKRLQDYGIEVR